MLRLSKNFLLLDFLYDQSTMDCVVHCGEQLSREVDSKLVEGSEVVMEGRYLCKTILDRIVKEHGPVSISAGLWFQDLPKQGNAHHPDNPVHRWSQEYGAASDVVVHSWVNQNKDPKGFKKALLGSNIEYHRFQSYSHRGSEVTTHPCYQRHVRPERSEWPPAGCSPDSPWTADSLRCGNRLRRTFGCGSILRLSA